MAKGYIGHICPPPQGFEPLGKAVAMVLEGVVLKRRAANSAALWNAPSRGFGRPSEGAQIVRGDPQKSLGSGGRFRS